MGHLNGKLGRLAGMALLIATVLSGMAISSGHVVAQDALPDPSTTIRVMNVAEGGPAVDISVDGEQRFENLAYGDVTDYSSVVPGDHDFVIHPSGSDSTDGDITSTQTVESGNAYIVLIFNSDDGSITSQSFEVDLDRTDQGQARVRLLNASPDAGKLDLYSGDDEWFSGVDYQDASDYKQVDWGKQDLEIQNDDDGSALITAPGSLLNWGVAYDTIVYGSQANQTLDSITLTTSVSPRCTTLLGIKGLPTDMCISVANLAPGGLVPVDVYINNFRILDSVGLGDRINYVAVPIDQEGNAEITLVPARMGSNSAIASVQLDAKQGEAFEVIIVGDQDNPAVLSSRVNLTPPPTGQARVRLLQGYPNAPKANVSIKDGPTLFENVEYKNVTDYVVLDAGTYTIQITDSDSGDVLDESEVTFEQGMTYDTVVTSQVAVTIEGAIGTPEATPSATTSQSAMFLTFSAPTFPRGGIVHFSSAEVEADATPAASPEATPTDG